MRCLICSKKLIKNQKKTCSLSCRGKYARQHVSEINMLYHIIVIAICKNCKKKFNHVAIAKRIFCSLKCTYAYGSRRGIPLSKESAKKLSQKYTGIGNPAYRHGLTKQREYTKREYVEWRKKVFKRDNYTCQHCFAHGGYLEADHIKPYFLFLELALDINNGQTLCRNCHHKKTSIEIKQYWRNQYTESKMLTALKKSLIEYTVCELIKY